jgi:hypothetical protein
MHPDLDPPHGLAALLRRLPGEAAPPYGYAEFERRAAARVRAQRRHAGGQLLALAAVAVVCTLAVLLRAASQTAVVPDAAPRLVTRAIPGPPDDDTPPGGSALATQRWLDGLPRQPAMVHVGADAAVMGVEDRIAQVDDLLSAARAAGDTGRTRALQTERERLMATLVQVRYAHTLASAAP